MGQTLRLVFISLRPIRQLADQGDNSKDRYKLTVFLKVIFREEFSASWRSTLGNDISFVYVGNF
ncbi:hypothetical protein D4R71_01490 [bacterium]|nr:MAG: hypothetical protein D4R71_01490 [bacterium]